MIALVAGGSYNSAFATSSEPDLGKPTNAVSPNQFFPLSGFTHYDKPVVHSSRIEFLYIGAAIGSTSLSEEWPVIKALEQFGVVGNAPPLVGQCQSQPCTYLGFNLDHVQFRSRYVSFVFRNLLDIQGKCHLHLPKDELLLLSRLRAHYNTPNVHMDCRHFEAQNVTLPIMRVGGYAQVGYQIVLTGDFQAPPGPTPNIPPPELSFDTVQKTLASGVEPKGSTLVLDVNAEANIMTAIICHADHEKPANACGRSVIKAIQKHIK